MYKALDLWLPAYLRQRRPPTAEGVTDLLLCVCDHFEPFHATDQSGALARMELWLREYPKLIQPFQDADGTPPRHTFFYPIEQYDPKVIAALAELCRRSGGEVEIHLHHDQDTPEHLRETLAQGKRDLAGHGLLARDAAGGVRYGFVHGNWALDNSHPAGRHCGVTNELSVLRATGCYADFTMPSAPDSTQTRIINRVYYAHGGSTPKAHDTGIPAQVKPGARGDAVPNRGLSRERDDLLLVQGPLGLNWERRKFGLLPRIENGDLSGHNPPRLDRLRVWHRLGIHVVGRPEWVFIKLHTHGAIPENSGMLLGEPMRQFHQQLQAHYNDGRRFRFHYVSAREMVNIIHAAEDGQVGNPGSFREYRYHREQ